MGKKTKKAAKLFEKLSCHALEIADNGEICVSSSNAKVDGLLPGDDEMRAFCEGVAIAFAFASVVLEEDSQVDACTEMPPSKHISKIAKVFVNKRVSRGGRHDQD